MKQNAHYNFPEPKLTSWNCLFCPTDCPKPKGSSFTLINDKEQQQNLKFNMQEQANAWHFFAWKIMTY